MSNLLKTVRITDNIKYELYKKGNSKKYTIAYLDKEIKSQYYDFSLSDDFVIKESLIEFARINNKKTDYYKVIQNPYKEPFDKRLYGSINYPYYLNNTCKIIVEWVGMLPNPEFQLGPHSTGDEAVDYNKTLGIKRWIEGNVTNNIDNGESNITSTWVDVNGKCDIAYIIYKKVLIYLPDNTILIQTQNGLEYTNESNVNFIKYSNKIKDIDIIENVILNYIKLIVNNRGISYDDYKLKLCDPDTNYCNIIPYINPFEVVPTIIDKPVEVDIKDNQKINLTLDGISDNIHIKEKTDLPTFTVWIGNKPIMNNEEITFNDYIDTNELNIEYIENKSILT